MERFHIEESFPWKLVKSDKMDDKDLMWYGHIHKHRLIAA